MNTALLVIIYKDAKEEILRIRRDNFQTIPNKGELVEVLRDFNFMPVMERFFFLDGRVELQFHVSEENAKKILEASSNGTLKTS